MERDGHTKNRSRPVGFHAVCSTLDDRAHDVAPRFALPIDGQARPRAGVAFY
jgi:hypothetical protein